MPESDARSGESLEESAGKRCRECAVLAEFGGKCRKAMLGECSSAVWRKVPESDARSVQF